MNWGGFAGGVAQANPLGAYTNFKQMRQQQPMIDAQVESQNLQNRKFENSLQEIALGALLEGSGYQGDSSVYDGVNVYLPNAVELTGTPLGYLPENLKDSKTQRDLSIAQQALSKQGLEHDMDMSNRQFGFSQQQANRDYGLNRDQLNFSQQQANRGYNLDRDQFDFNQSQWQDQYGLERDKLGLQRDSMNAEQRAMMNNLGNSGVGGVGTGTQSEPIDFSTHRLVGNTKDGRPVFTNHKQLDDSLAYGDHKATYVDQYGNFVSPEEVTGGQDSGPGFFSRIAGGIADVFSRDSSADTQDPIAREAEETLRGAISNQPSQLVRMTGQFMNDFQDKSDQDILSILEGAMSDPTQRELFIQEYGLSPEEVYKHLTSPDELSNTPDKWRSAAQNQSNRR